MNTIAPPSSSSVAYWRAPALQEIGIVVSLVYGVLAFTRAFRKTPLH